MTFQHCGWVQFYSWYFLVMAFIQRWCTVLSSYTNGMVRRRQTQAYICTLLIKSCCTIVLK